MTTLHFALLYHRPIRVPTILFSLSLLIPVYVRGMVALPSMVMAKALLSVVMITVNHRRSPNHAEFFLNMRQWLPVLWGTYLALDLALYLLLATLTLWVR
ncbi:hypothetical protein [Lewinella sp. IMCC34191]|uniref:hypothetical protein n=1 Tax=Lewinella sp. IMCC34191 TaxID=2259172 RepID=UPI000E2658E8|nr:hypothetical protein [Lewinella sp. IMCC34191]